MMVKGSLIIVNKKNSAEEQIWLFSTIWAVQLIKSHGQSWLNQADVILYNMILHYIIALSRHFIVVNLTPLVQILIKILPAHFINIFMMVTDLVWGEKMILFPMRTFVFELEMWTSMWILLMCGFANSVPSFGFLMWASSARLLRLKPSVACQSLLLIFYTTCWFNKKSRQQHSLSLPNLSCNQAGLLLG